MALELGQVILQEPVLQCSYTEVMQAELDCLEAQQALTDYINFNEILFSVKRHSSQECLRFAEDLLGVSIASLEEDNDANNTKRGFIARIKNAWNALWNLIKRFFGWLKRIIGNIIDALTGKAARERKRKAEEEAERERKAAEEQRKKEQQEWHQRAKKEQEEWNKYWDDQWDDFFRNFGRRTSSGRNGAGQNNGGSNKRENETGSPQGVTLSCTSKSVTVLCSKSENLGTMKSESNIRVIETKVNEFSAAVNSALETGGAVFNEASAINRYCQMIKRIYSNVYNAAQGINAIFNNLSNDSTQNKKVANQLSVVKEVNRSFNDMNKKIMDFVRKDMAAIISKFRGGSLTETRNIRDTAEETKSYSSDRNKDIDNLDINKK